MKNDPHHNVIQEMKIQTTIQIKTNLLEWPKSEILTILNTGEDVEQQELSFIAIRNAKWYRHYGRQFGSCLQN